MKEQIKEELESLKESETWLVPNADKYLQWCIDRIEQLEKVLEMAMPIVEHNSPTLAKMIRHDLGKEE